MRKICFVTTISMTQKAFIIDTAKYLHEKKGYDITCICDFDGDFEEFLPSYIKYIPISMKRGISITCFSAILNLYKVFKKEKFDLVQYSTPNASFYASIASRLANIPIRLYCQWGIAYVGFNGFKRNVFKLFEKIICNNSTWVEPDSFGNLDFSHNEGLYKPEKSSVIWNGSASGVNFRKFDISSKVRWRDEIRNNYNIKNNSYVIGFIGRITRDKGINELFQACKVYFEENKSAILMLVGTEDKNSLIDSELYQWSLNENRVVYCGQTNHVEKYISAMDIFVLPSYREGFGTVVIEAQSMGVPVIISNIPGPRDAIIINETGFVVEKKNSLSLLLTIRKILSDFDNLKSMSKVAATFIHEKFNQDILFEKILKDRERLFSKIDS